VACPFCVHFSEVDFVDFGLKVFLGGLGEFLNEDSQLIIGSCFVYGCLGRFLDGYVYGSLFTFYPFPVFFQNLLWRPTRLWQNN
jgi:hypothetical protein